MQRRGFLALIGGAIAGIALDKAIPLGRVWSFPSKIVIPHRLGDDDHTADAIRYLMMSTVPLPALLADYDTFTVGRAFPARAREGINFDDLWGHGEMTPQVGDHLFFDDGKEYVVAESATGAPVARPRQPYDLDAWRLSCPRSVKRLFFSDAEDAMSQRDAIGRALDVERGENSKTSTVAGSVAAIAATYNSIRTR